MNELVGRFSLIQIEYSITVALKILDGTCQMSAEKQQLFLRLFQEVCSQHYRAVCEGGCFDETLLAQMLSCAFGEVLEESVRERIHACRLEAQKRVHKPLMQSFKQEVCEVLGFE